MRVRAHTLQSGSNWYTHWYTQGSTPLFCCWQISGEFSMTARETVNRLTRLQCEHARAGTTLNDGGGLYLEIKDSGRKLWRFRYTRPNASELPATKRRNRISLGEYPKPVSLVRARAQRDEYRADLVQGYDPAKSRRDAAVAVALSHGHTLKAVAATWFTKQAWSPGHLEEWKRTLANNVFDQRVERKPIGDWPIAEIEIRHVMAVLQRMEDKGLIETLHRCRQKLAHIFNRAIVLGLRTDNPVVPLTKEYKPRRRNVRGHLALPWGLVGQFQRDLLASKGTALTSLAVMFMLHTVQRNFEMRRAEWSDFDLRRELWTIPRDLMKDNPNAREDHLVPLSRQAIHLIEQIGDLGLSDRYVFPADRGSGAKHPWMSENTMQKRCDQMAYKGVMHIHGLRKTFSTRMNEYRPEFNSKSETDAIEMCIDHFERDPIRGTYNLAEHMDIRFDIMQTWADELERQRT